MVRPRVRFVLGRMLFAPTGPPGCRPLHRLRHVFPTRVGVNWIYPLANLGEAKKNFPRVWGELKSDPGLRGKGLSLKRLVNS